MNENRFLKTEYHKQGRSREQGRDGDRGPFLPPAVISTPGKLTTPCAQRTEFLGWKSRVLPRCLLHPARFRPEKPNLRYQWEFLEPSPHAQPKRAQWRPHPASLARRPSPCPGEPARSALVGEAVPAVEQLLCREPVVRHVRRAPANQVVGHG